MSRVFAYLRVSTADQSTKNQRQEITAAGFSILANRVVEETISGSIAVLERPKFQKLVDRLEEGDILVATKLDRLGRNAMDVSKCVAELADRGVRVHCLALGGVDLTSPAGKMTMGVINHVAQFERDLLIERTNAGLARAKAEGKRLGPPLRVSPDDRSEIARRLSEGESKRKLAGEFGTSRQTVARIEKEFGD